MANDLRLDGYLREREFPTMWCAGCGHGITVKGTLRAIAKMGWKKDDVLAVAGIGCSARAPAYCDFNSIQTTHGRAIAYATGMKMHRPNLHTVLLLGDGDCIAIGGNHFIHGAKRNIDLTVIVMNNSIYGMTGGQISPTTPFMCNSATTPFGNFEEQINLCDIAVAAGATYVARTTAYHVNQVAALIEGGLKNKGFSVIEVIEPCPTSFGRKNEFKNPVSMYEWLRDAAVSVERAKQLSPEELKNKIVTGVLHQSSRPEFIAEYAKMAAKAQEMAQPDAGSLELMPAEMGKFPGYSEVRLSGSGGQGLVLAGIMLSEATIKQGKNTAHLQSIGPEARGGTSRSEVIISDAEIINPKITAPDVLLAMTQEAADKYSGGVKPAGLILLDSTFAKERPEVAAKTYQYPITEFARDELGNPLVANVLALGILAKLMGTLSINALEEVVKVRVPHKVKELNIKALHAGYKIGDEILEAGA